ncbi:hypothetical protein RQP46_005160 [Phenoliferia psychrophenolica]
MSRTPPTMVLFLVPSNQLDPTTGTSQLDTVKNAIQLLSPSSSHQVLPYIRLLRIVDMGYSDLLHDVRAGIDLWKSKGGVSPITMSVEGISGQKPPGKASTVSIVLEDSFMFDGLVQALSDSLVKSHVPLHDHTILDGARLEMLKHDTQEGAEAGAVALEVLKTKGMVDDPVRRLGSYAAFTFSRLGVARERHLGGWEEVRTFEL